MQVKTVKALLSFEALARIHPQAEHYFCPDRECQVVYYEAEQTFTVDDVRLPVFQKDAGPDTLVCYCFGFTRGDVLADAGQTIPAAIGEHVKAGRCGCDLRNPQGSCCLGNVKAVS